MGLGLEQMIGVGIIVVVIVIGISLCLEFLPTIIALAKGAPNRGHVITMNLANFVVGIVSAVVFGFIIPAQILNILISLCLLIWWIVILVQAIKGR